MAVYRSVHLSFWTDTKVDDEFTPEDKYFYLYLLTNPHTNICGCYEIGEKQCSRETGYNTETISRLLYRFEHVHDVIRYDAKTKEVLILNWHKYNWTRSEKLVKNISSVASYIKSDAFRNYIFSLINGEEGTKEIPYPYPMDTSVSVSVSDTDTNTVTDTVSNRGIVKGGKSTRFVPPSIEDIRAYCFERGNKIDAEEFFDYYASVGWKVGNKPMKDWKASVRTWERKKKKEGNQTNNIFRKILEDEYGSSPNSNNPFGS